MKSIAIKIPIMVIAITLYVSCGGKTPVETIGFRPDMRIRNFTSLNYKEGELSWRLEARVSSYYLDENRSIAEGVVLNYFKDKKLAAVIKADKAIINTNSRHIELIGNVDAVTPAGHRLLTSKIQWNNQNKFLDTDEPVRIIRKNGDVIEGIGMRANYNLEDYEIKKRVIAVTRTPASIHKKGK
jgi:LPS export ABC transporter protein LptC